MSLGIWFIRVLKLSGLCVLLSATAAFAQLTPSLEKEISSNLKRRLDEVRRKDKESKDLARFHATSLAIAEALEEIAERDINAGEIPANMRTKLEGLLENEALGLTKTQKGIWKEAIQDAIDKYETTEVEGFNSEEASHWNALIRIVARELSIVAQAAGTPVDVGDPSLEAIDTAQPTGIEVNLYEKLTEYGVIYYDDRFRINCREMAASLDRGLEQLASENRNDVDEFKRDVVARLWAIIKKNDEGDDPAIDAWRKGMIVIINSLGQEIRFAKEDVTNVLVWKAAFERLSRALKGAIKADEEEVRRGTGGALAGDFSTTSAMGGGSAIGGWHHNRKMAHISRVHQRRMYRIVRMRARY